MIDVAVIGMGPWGLAVLERLVHEAGERGASGRALTVHVVEPAEPGPGVYGGDQPDYLILNTPCGQHSTSPYPGRAAGGHPVGFFEWATAVGYRWAGDRCQVGGSGRPISPEDFLPRRLMGEYLAWSYRVIVGGAPDTVRVVHHRTTALDVVAEAGKEHVRLADGGVVSVDHVVLTTGQTANRVPRARALPPYPVTGLGERFVPAGSSVAVQGMGLVAVDVVTALTAGRGGSFVRRGGRLHYRRSGAEPRVALFSRSGLPYCAKSMGAADLTGTYQPLVLTPAVAAGLRDRARRGGERLDARHHLLPLVLAEMTACFYVQSARLADGPGAASAMAERLGRAWRSGCFEELVGNLADQYGVFDAERELLGGEEESFVSSKDYQARMAEMLESDVAAALVPGGASPREQAHEVLRALRDSMRTVLEFGGLTAASHRDFQANVRNRVARLVAGPPVRRCEELLALMDAEVVRMPFGPSPAVHSDASGHVVRSRLLDRPYEERVDHLVVGHLDTPSVHRSASPLLRRLFDRGRIRQMELDGEEVGSIELTEEFHPVGPSGRIGDRLWVFGALTEGARYYTAYIPSPASRVRAFVDAGRCASRIVDHGPCTTRR